MKKLKLYLIAALAAGMLLAPAGSSRAGLLSHKKLPEGLPKHWDKKIPIPPGSTVSTVKPPVGIVQAVEFDSPGDFDTLINFYNTELPKAGFDLGPHVKVPARRAYNLNFSKASVQDTVSIYPDSEDPTKFNVKVVYEIPSRRRHLVKLLLERWHLWPKFWRSETPPTPVPAAPSGPGDTSAASAPVTN